MDKQKLMLLLLGGVVILGVLVVLWNSRQTAKRLNPEQARQNKSALQQQVGVVQSNPNVPPEVKQWLEYNLRQQPTPQTAR